MTTRFRRPQYEERLPHIDCLVEQLRKLVQAGGDPLFWRVALRKVANELESRKPGVPHGPPPEPPPQRLVLPVEEPEHEP